MNMVEVNAAVAPMTAADEKDAEDLVNEAGILTVSVRGIADRGKTGDSVARDHRTSNRNRLRMKVNPRLNL